MTRSRSKTASAQLVDTPTEEWLAKFDWKFEPRDADSDHFVVIRNLTANALDRYRSRKELDDDNFKNERLYQAGDRLRRDWEMAGLTLMARPRFEPGHDAAAEVFSNSRLAARDRIKHAMVELGPTRGVVVDCCVFGEPARRYVEILRLGLRTLADHYGMP